MNIDVYVDSSCAGNPGVGGYSAVLQCNGAERIVRGNSQEVVSNNAMTLEAIVNSLVWINKHQKKPCVVTFYTTNEYVLKCVQKNHDGTKKKVGWFNGRQNSGKWFQVINETVRGKHTVTFQKMTEKNEQAKTIAREECIKASHALLKEG